MEGSKFLDAGRAGEKSLSAACVGMADAELINNKAMTIFKTIGLDTLHIFT